MLLSATLTGSMHGVNLLLICMVPQCFERYGNISTVSGVLNACTYIGSALSTYGIAALSEVIGWQSTIFVWFCVTILGGLICLVCVKPWKKKFMDQQKENPIHLDGVSFLALHTLIDTIGGEHRKMQR